MTSDRQALKPSPTVTVPLAIRCSLSFRVTVRLWFVDHGRTVKSVVLVAVPPGVVTVILPVVAPDGTVAVTEVAVLGVNVAVIPLNLTAVTPVRFVPVIVTLVPDRTARRCERRDRRCRTHREVGGAGAGPPTGVVTWISAGRGADRHRRGDRGRRFDDVDTSRRSLLNMTGRRAQKFVPVMVTTCPTGPPVGVNEVIVGAAAAVTEVVRRCSWCRSAVVDGDSAARRARRTARTL